MSEVMLLIMAIDLFVVFHEDLYMISMSSMISKRSKSPIELDVE